MDKLDKILDEITSLKISTSVIESEIKNIKKNIPQCNKEVVEQKIKTNRWLIGLIFSGMLGIFLFSIRGLLN